MTDTLTTPDTSPLDDRFIDLAFVQEPDEPVEAKRKPRPGSYFLKFGNVTGRVRPAFTFPSGDVKAAYLELQPNLTIVMDADGDQTFDGFALNRYYTLDTQRQRFRGVERNWSTLTAEFKMMGVALPESGNADDLIAAAQALTGQVTPVAVPITYRGELRYKNYIMQNDGTKLYLDEKVFRRGDQAVSVADYDGEYASLGFVVDGAFTLDRPNENVEHDKVFVNIEPVPWGWKAKA
jgi:hypothetical protein